MTLTSEVVEQYIGGQMVIRNELMGHIHCGQVENISVEDNCLHGKLSWIAEGEGYPPFPTKWVKTWVDSLYFDVSLDQCKVVSIGATSSKGICIAARTDLVYLYPPGEVKLDPSQVEGLNPT